MPLPNCIGRVAALLVLGMMGAAVLAAQEPLQFNVPYRCADGTVYIIQRCAKNARGGEMCAWREEKNGQLVVEAVSVRTQMYGRLKPCPPDGAARGVTPAAQSARPANGPLNPPYLSEMPSVDRVMTAMKTADPRETALRQMGAFYELMEIIKTLSGPREFRGFMPDETRILEEYSVAQYKVGQAADAAFPGPYKDEKNLSANTPYHYSRWDARFGVQGLPVFQLFFSPQLQAQFRQITGADNARRAAKVAQDTQTAARAREPNASAASGNGDPQFVRNDRGTLAARRCVESGRSEMECIGEGLKTGLNDLMGPMVGGVMGDNLPGTGGMSTGPAQLRLSGWFRGAGFYLLFNDTAAVISCGTLVPDGHEYSVDLKGNQVVVRVDNSPKPIDLTLRSDGQLVGPTSFDVAGRVVVGHRAGSGGSAGGYEAQTHTTTTERQIAAADVPNYSAGTVHQNGMESTVSEQTTSTTYEPAWPTPSRPAEVITAPKTERCSAGVLAGTPRVTLTEGMKSLIPGKKAAGLPMGLRLLGTYAGQSGLSIEFRTDLATVDCGQAHVAMPYQMENAGGQLTVKVANPAGPFSLQLRPDKTLEGSGKVDVAGRVVSGATDDKILYASRNASCAVGTLSSSEGGAGANVAARSASSDRGPSAGAGAASAAPGNVMNPSAGPAVGNATLAVTANFPAGANPLAGQGLLLMKDTFDNALRRSGAPIPEGRSAGMLWMDLVGYCHQAPKDCANASRGIAPYIAGQVKLDSNGQGAFARAVPAGTYYVTGSGSINNHAIFWDLKVDLKPGANSVALDQRNGQPLN